MPQIFHVMRLSEVGVGATTPFTGDYQVKYDYDGDSDRLTTVNPGPGLPGGGAAGTAVQYVYEPVGGGWNGSNLVTQVLVHRVRSERVIQIGEVPMRRYIAAGFASQCWIVAAITLLIGCGSSVKPDPAIVRVVELSREQDREHVEEMVARDGSRWFVGSEPAIDLRHVDLGQSTVERCDDGFYLSLWLTAEGERRMHAWLKARIGRPFGVICDGVLPTPGNVPGVIRNAVTVMGYPTLEEASRTMAALRQTKRAMERAQRK